MSSSALRFCALLHVKYGSISDQHRFVCHADGGECPDGCQAPADPKRVTLLEDAWDEYMARECPTATGLMQMATS